MRQIKDFDKVQAVTDRVKLPAGYYVGKCVGAKVVEYQGKNGSFERLEIAVDITEGEFKDYYKNDFDTNNREDKKWKGVCRMYIPTDDGSEKDEFTKRLFKGLINAFEDSNSGYHWAWDESTLKGLKVGIAVRDKEWEMNGKTGLAPEIFKLVSVDDAKNGKLAIPAPKYLNGSAPAVAEQSAAANSDEPLDYPF